MQAVKAEGNPPVLPKPSALGTLAHPSSVFAGSKNVEFISTTKVRQLQEGESTLWSKRKAS